MFYDTDMKLKIKNKSSGDGEAYASLGFKHRDLPKAGSIQITFIQGLKGERVLTLSTPEVFTSFVYFANALGKFKLETFSASRDQKSMEVDGPEAAAKAVVKVVQKNKELFPEGKKTEAFLKELTETIQGILN